MTNPGLIRGLKKAARTLIQLAAAGALTALIDLLAHGLAPQAAGALMTFWTALMAFLQNYLETNGTIPAILPATGLVTTTVGGAVTNVVGTVDAVKTDVNQVTGQVLDTAGGLVGSVSGLVISK
jgi:hypothetical protein